MGRKAKGGGKRETTRKIMEEIQDTAELETIGAMGDQSVIMQILRRYFFYDRKMYTIQ
jgi:hypothetical protein